MASMVLAPSHHFRHFKPCVKTWKRHGGGSFTLKFSRFWFFTVPSWLISHDITIFVKFREDLVEKMHPSCWGMWLRRQQLGYWWTHWTPNGQLAEPLGCHEVALSHQLELVIDGLDGRYPRKKWYIPGMLGLDRLNVRWDVALFFLHVIVWNVWLCLFDYLAKCVVEVVVIMFGLNEGDNCWGGQSFYVWVQVQTLPSCCSKMLNDLLQIHVLIEVRRCGSCLVLHIKHPSTPKPVWHKLTEPMYCPFPSTFRRCIFVRQVELVPGPSSFQAVIYEHSPQGLFRRRPLKLVGRCWAQGAS